jgi:hypothetical protein
MRPPTQIFSPFLKVLRHEFRFWDSGNRPQTAVSLGRALATGTRK